MVQNGEKKSDGFDPEPYMMAIKGKKYLPVAARIAWFRAEHPDWCIEAEHVALDQEYAVWTARIYDEHGALKARAHKQEYKRAWEDHLEKAETGAIGRALAVLGYGTLQAAELMEDSPDDPVDSPVAPRPAGPPTASRSAPPPIQQRKEVARQGVDERTRLVEEAVKRGIPWTAQMSSARMGDVAAERGLPVVRTKEGSMTVAQLWNTVHAAPDQTEQETDRDE